MTIVSAGFNVKGVAGIIEAILGDWGGERHGIAYVARMLFLGNVVVAKVICLGIELGSYSIKLKC
jgi:hypothetical protein